MDIGRLLFLLGLQVVAITAYEDTLQLVNMLYRHGDRSPTVTFPTNPVPTTAWPQGLGALTQLGMRQHHSLGEYMRGRYSSFVNASYSVFETRVRSTDKDRTLMSALSHLSGLYPPSGRQLWDKSILWQPIPVHTVPVPQDNLLSLDSLCPRADAIYKEEVNSPKIQAFIKEKQPMLNFLSQKCGKEILFTNAYQIRDALFCQAIHNFTAPSWSNATVIEQLGQIADLEFTLGFITEEGARLRGGTLLKEMIANMLNKTDGLETPHFKTDGLATPHSKLFMYSAHDDTVGALLRTLQSYPGVPPPYAATVLVELLKDTSGAFYVQVLYKNSSSEPAVLRIPGCATKCPLDEFISLTKPYIPLDWKKECGLQTQDLLIEGSLTFGLICGVIGFAVAAVCVVSIYAFAIIVKKRKVAHAYNAIHNELDF